VTDHSNPRHAEQITNQPRAGQSALSAANSSRGSEREAVISTRGLVKNYGAIAALKGVSLTVHRGEIYGLLGQNGAGKTTLVKILLGVTKLSYGEASVLGEPAGKTRVRARIGFLPEDHRFPEYHTAASLMQYYGRLLGVPGSDLRHSIPEYLEMVGLKGRMNYKIRTYSKGMKQRLGIAQALFHKPDVIFLDEPTDGVDPVGRREIRGILQGLKDRGVTIFINSHLLGEVELICDHVAILQRGEVIREGEIQQLLEQKGVFEVGLAMGQTVPREDLAAKGYLVSKFGDMWEIGLKDGQTIDPVVDLLRARGLCIRHLTEKRVTLEDLFVQTVEAAEPGIDQPAPRPRGRS
jgi:ABC-2 type transport system ATP-binding protein